jgi:hypothetical protein
VSIEVGCRSWDSVIDDVTYRMTLLESDKRFYVSWVCMRCAELAGSALRGATLEEAVERAKVRRADHHNLFHCKTT